MSNTFKEKVVADAKRSIRERQENQKQLFKQKYNKPKDYVFPNIDDINMDRFFCFPKFSEGFYMSNASIAIYPVLCLLSNFEDNEWFQISQKNIAKMAGVSINTVAKGITDLEKRYLYNEPLLQKWKQTKVQRHYYVYKVNFIRKDDIKGYRGSYFIFHKCIIESGVWADLQPRAKALYVSMRMSAHFDELLYEEVEDLQIDVYSGDVSELYNENYKYRKWDVCNTPLTELCRNVNISPVNLRPIIEQLENHRLIEREYNHLYKVFLKPKIKEQN